MPTASSKSTSDPGEAAADRHHVRPPRLFGTELFLLSGADRTELLERADHLGAHLDRPEPARLQDLAFTVSREYAPERQCLAIVAASHEDLREKLQRAASALREAPDRSIEDRRGIYYATERLGADRCVFLFPGENAQYVNMLRELCLHFPEMREAFDVADAACGPVEGGFRPSALNFPAPFTEPAGGDLLAQWEKAVALVHTANTAMRRLLDGLQLRPHAVLGHSFGEFSALEMAGVLDAGEGETRIRYARDAFVHIHELATVRDLPEGRLLTVGGAERAQIEPLLRRFPDHLDVAMENCPLQFILCAVGPDQDAIIDEVERHLAGEGALCARLPIRRPYHTRFFEPAFPYEKAYVEKMGVHPPRLEVWSCATTEPFPPEAEQIVETAARHWMRPVRFQKTIEKLHDRGFRIFLDVGPRGNLCAFVADILRDRPHLTVALNKPRRGEILQLHHALGTLAAHGVPLDVGYLHERWGSRVVPLDPTPAAGKRRKPRVRVQLPIALPQMSAAEIPVPARRPAPAATAAESPDPAPAASPAGFSGAMLAYLDTMDRFLAVQREVLGPVLRGIPARTATATAPAIRRTAPLLGEIRDEVAGESFTAVRRFDVGEDLYLQDHALGTHLSTTDPDLKALPVMPLLLSLEMVAEAGARLFPGKVVSAITEIRANRWILFTDGSARLRTEARRVEAGPEGIGVRVGIHQEDLVGPPNRPPMVEAIAILTDAYPPPPPSRAGRLPESARIDWPQSEVYPRRTFHGPRFQGIRTITHLADRGVDGALEVLPRRSLLRSNPDAAWAYDFLLFDSMGQAVWPWGSREPFGGTCWLPFGAAALRFYGPPPEPGTRLPFNLRIRSNVDRVVVADCEALSSDGRVLMFLEGLTDRELPISRPLHRLMLEPVEQDFADVMDLPVPLPGGGRALLSVVEDFPVAVLQGSFGVWRHALALLALSPPERREWRERQFPLAREIDWLLGRAAAKDAVRRLLQERAGRRLAMTDIRLETEPGGRPVVAGGWKCELPSRPAISIAHTEGMAAAVGAEGGRVGLDVEKVQPPSQDFLDGGFSAAEITCLPAGSPEERAEWILRAWCAKEAVGKALGSGVPHNPRELAVASCDASAGTVTLNARGGTLREAGAGEGESLRAVTFRRGTHVFGIARLP